MKLTKQEKLTIFENAICWIVVFAMYVYGFAKIIQFNGATEINTPVSELTGMQLMWAFYGYSKPFVIVLGFFEVLGGTLLLITKTRLLGCLFTSTILVNVILQDIFYNVNQGALRAAILYQFLILVILWMHRNQIITSIKNLIITKNEYSNKRKILFQLFLAFVLFVLFRITEYYLTAFNF